MILNYFFSKNDINKKILINVNKKSEEQLIIEYNFRNGQNGDKKIKKYGEEFEINYKNNDNNNNKEGLGLDNIESIEILEVKITPSKSGKIDFRININGRKDLPVYLDPEEIEYGIVKKNEDRFYYFDYYFRNDQDAQQIFLNSKGMARIKSIKLFKKETLHKKPEDISSNSITNKDIHFLLGRIND